MKTKAKRSLAKSVKTLPQIKSPYYNAYLIASLFGVTSSMFTEKEGGG